VLQVQCIPHLLVVCQGLLTSCEKVMNEEEDRLLNGIISLVFSLMNLMLNFCKRCIFGFKKKKSFKANWVCLCIVHILLTHLSIEQLGKKCCDGLQSKMFITIFNRWVASIWKSCIDNEVSFLCGSYILSTWQLYFRWVLFTFLFFVDLRWIAYYKSYFISGQ
jgi:hypothetical protein